MKRIFGWEVQISILLGLGLGSSLALGAGKKGAPRKYPEGKCIRILYDAAPSAKPESPHQFLGRTHAIYLQNLLGHFPHIQQILTPIEEYQPGDLERCQANIYLGTYFENNIPQSFFSDYMSTKNNVMWAGYNVWNLGADALRDLWKVNYVGQTRIDLENRDERGLPGFYKFYDYKGETFEKHGDWDKKDPRKFVGAFEITKFEYGRDEVDPYTISWARHSGTNEEQPYILKNNNHWYIGDSPFSFITVEDRYLIFSDILFDFLEEEPMHKEKPALFRIEDLHPNLPLWQLFRLTEMLKRKGASFAIAMVPFFVDPNGALYGEKDSFLPMTSYQPFLEFMKYAKTQGGSFIFHGVTHQLGHHLNPWNAMSGDDAEFWDMVKNAPVEYDSAEWAINRLQDGHAFMERQGIKVAAWEAPHYQASPLDYTIFGQVFDWNIGRVTYFPHIRNNWPGELNDSHAINRSGARDNKQRLEKYRELSVDYPSHLLPCGQFFPYEIYGDVYGQRLVPENTGHFEPFFGDQAPEPRGVDDLIRVVRRNRVLRDVWASFFMHAHLLDRQMHEGLGEYPGDTRPLEKFIDALVDAGYKFVSLKEYTKEFHRPKRAETIYTSKSNIYR